MLKEADQAQRQNREFVGGSVSIAVLTMNPYAFDKVCGILCLFLRVMIKIYKMNYINYKRN